jgi:hypothetical protein
MNFLLHRHLAARALEDPVAGYGAMLPDLWRLLDRRVRVRAVPPVAPDASVPALAGLLGGIAHHLDEDAWFHRAPVFVDGEHRVAEALRALHLGVGHLALFAHLAWELLLDGALIRREGLPAIRAAVAHGADAARAHTAASLVLCHPAAAAWEGDAQRAFAARLARVERELLEGDWIAHYRDGQGVARVVSSVRGRLGLAELDAGQCARLGHALEGLRGEADDGLAAILRERA